MARSPEPFQPEAPVFPEIAAGAVLAHEDVQELLLLHEPKEDRWCFPKGHVEPGESLVDAAVREITEETGIKEFTLLPEIGEIHYRFFVGSRGVNVLKSTIYFLAVTPDRRPYPEEIFDDYRWSAPSDAEEVVRYPAEKSIIAAAVRALQNRTGALRHYG